MTHSRSKIFIAGLVLITAVGFLAIAGVREGWVYFLRVDQFINDKTYHDQRVRLHGFVGRNNLHTSPVDLLAFFDLHGETSSIRVEYHGVIPDLFKADADVVVEGRLNESGVFIADTLMTKCASKYETIDGEAPHSNPYLTEFTP